MELVFVRESVHQLRDQFTQKTVNIPQQYGVYRWWFPIDSAKVLIAPLVGVDESKIQKEFIGDKEYWCLYFGISKDLRARSKWHIAQSHTESAIKHGFLSTLRQTLSALLQKPMSDSQECVNHILDKAYWDWCVTESEGTTKAIEKKYLSEGYYPLNITNNKGVSREIIHQLKKFRKEYRK
ncbi:hypothetical protein A4G19_05595 [Pasteurellaceae bacterium Macca]|nr:hypothetical protein [Pasteurellaceae bacterium Macca]